MPCAFQFFLSEKFDFLTHVLHRFFKSVLCNMRINIQSGADLGVPHDRLDRLVIGLDLKHSRTERMPQAVNGEVWEQ